MALQYRIERKGNSLLIGLSTPGARRVLYLDVARSLATEKERPLLDFLTKLQMRTTRDPQTVTFERVEVPPAFVKEALKKLGDAGICVSEEKPAEKPPLQVRPRLVLSDSSGCLAELWMDYQIELVAFVDFAPTVDGRERLKKEERSLEKDLIEAGYTPKNGTHFYCPQEKVREALLLLLAVGWQVVDPQGKPISSEVHIEEKKGRIALRASFRGMIDPKLQMQGVWENGALFLKKSQIGALLPLIALKEVRWEETLLALAQGLKTGASLSRSPPGLSFRGELLPYQQKGVDWLQFLYTWGFSALLADEMGLGKTVQVLAFLSRLRPNLPVLIVAPSSLLFNWRAEIERFLPHMHDVEVISYTALRMKAKEFAEKRYEVVVLDESNAIKTASTQTAQAAFQLTARFKICLSGTPMENRPEEISSQFRFLMPDLFGKEPTKEQIRPFILKRRKEEVALDLPEKIEQTVWLEMDAVQKELYDATRQGAQPMQVLEMILRLRQVCLDPRLLGYLEAGAKAKQLVADLEEGLQEGRKILVFSQFPSFLHLMRQEFPQALLLEGSTPTEQRGRLVEQFQTDPECPLFFMSLKAAGVGLNLTAADTVLLLDPWWNEAVENQAIARSHRIGQKKTVLVKRYLIWGTIEEKMLQLKGKKQEAADQLLDFAEEMKEEDFRLLLETL